MDMYKIAEYEALRATIRERGTARMCLILAGVLAWGLLTLALNALEFDRAASVVPLTILAATFEISFFIHTGVERVGRYLQVFFEEGQDGWEHTIMAYGRNNPGSGANPLFIPLFVVIAVLSLAGSIPAAARHPGWIAISMLSHILFALRMAAANRRAAAQRALDLDRFRALKNSAASNQPASN
jgi:hypothetical protein